MAAVTSRCVAVAFGCILGFAATSAIFLILAVDLSHRVKVKTDPVAMNVPHWASIEPSNIHSPPSKDVIVRSVYLDNRPRRGHRNASVFMLEARRTILERHLITGCSVGGLHPARFKVRPLLQNPVSLSNQPNLTHFLAMVDCYDLSVGNGSNASIRYVTAGRDSTPITAWSERPLIIPQQYQRAGVHGIPKIVVCVIVFDKPPFLNEWLLYQKTIGVDHIYMTAEDSFVKAGGFENAYLRQLVKEGFVSFEVWKQWLNDSEVRYHSQALAYQDCVYRLRGTYDYAFVLDHDDFFIPRVPGKNKIHYYIENWCKNSGSCEFKWTEFYPDCGMENKFTRDGNITNLLTSTAHLKRSERKSLHNLLATLDVGVHIVHTLIHGYKRDLVPENIAYLAHIRVHKMPPDGKC